MIFLKKVIDYEKLEIPRKMNSKLTPVNQLL